MSVSFVRKVRESSASVSNPANFAALKKFIEDDREKTIASINELDATENKISKTEAHKRRAKMISKNKRLLSDSSVIVLSDEQSSEEDIGLLGGTRPENASES